MGALRRAVKAFVGWTHASGAGLSGQTRRLSRAGAAVLSAVGTLLVAMALGGITGAAANAANPLPTTAGTATVNADGSVTVDLNGTWTWPGQACAGRYGEGWAVDWWGISASTTAPNFSLSDASLVNPPGTTTTGTLSFAGVIPIAKAGPYFHVPQYYDGETVNSPSTCTDTGAGGGATSSGAWSATATYPSVSDVPQNLCVILYDEHGSEGKISNSANDFSTTNDHDNSIQTNAFNPANGAGYCLSTSFVPSVSVTKSGPATGNANGTGTYTLTATNSGTGPANNVTVTDSLPVGETFVSSSNSTCTASSGGAAVAGTGPGNSQNLSCNVSVAAGSSTSFTVTVSYGANVSGTLTDCATVSGQTTPSCVPTIFQGIAGHIYLCSNGSATTTEVPGGALSATGPQNIASGANPLVDPGVPAGTYSMTAAPPSGYQLVTCGGSSTVSNGGMSATESVVVPSGGTGTGIFYVTPVAPSITLTVVKTNDANGSGVYAQSETATSPGENVPFRAVITNTSSVPVTITSLSDVWPGSLAIKPACATTVIGVTLAPQGSVTCDFTVDNYAPAAGGSVTNTITVIGCQSTNANTCGNGTSTSTVTSPPPTQPSQSITLSVTKTNDANGSGVYAQTETATSAGEAVPFRVMVTNTSSVPVVITSLTDSWPSQAPFSPNCSAALVDTTLAAGASEACDFTLADYAPTSGNSVTNTVVVTGCQASNETNCVSTPANSTVNGPGTAPATKALAFTGPPAQLHLMLVLGLSLASCGFFFIWFARPRRRAVERS